MAKKRSFSKYTTEAIRLLGRQIKLGRKQRRWSEIELAERAGIARSTLQNIEKGDSTSAIGLVFEVATLVGVRLFETDINGIIKYRVDTESQLTLLPKHTHALKRDLDDDF
jgi:transcriptional regulator with XRE-family HTH domain